MLDEMGDVVAVPVPVGFRGVPALGNDHRPAPLGEEQQREACGDDRVLDPPTAEGAGEVVLGADEHFRPLEVPVGVADEPPGSEPPDTLEAVEVVVVPGLAGHRILHHRKPLPEPFQPPLDELRGCPTAAAGDGVARCAGGRCADVLGSDPDAGDAGARHAS